MTKLPSKSRRTAALGTAAIVSFSLTLIGASVALLAGVVPVNLNFGDRVDVGTLLFVAPILALVLAVVFEVTRIAFQSSELPEPRRQQVLAWTPGRREG